MKNHFWVHVIFIWTVFVQTGCNPCKRIAKNHPECFTQSEITIHDTVRIPEIKADTVFSATHSRDTVVLQKDRLTVKYYQSNDTVFLSGECRDSVITREIRVPVLTPSNSGSLDWYWIVILTCAGIFALMQIIRRIR